MEKDAIEKLLTKIAIKNAKDSKGCIFVIMKNPIKYSALLSQDIKPFNIFENQRRLQVLSTVDGACIIDINGKLLAYSAKIDNVKTFKGYGMRHSAAFTASKKGNTVIMSSEEDAKVRIFKDGKMIIQIDSTEKDIEKKSSQLFNMWENIGVGTAGTLATAVIAPTAGLSLIPGIIIFGSAYQLIKFLKQKKK
jgi:hypothetical protein